MSVEDSENGCFVKSLISCFPGYESQFDKKSFGADLELMDLESFFRECDLYPSGGEIEEGLDVITQGKQGSNISQL